MYCIKAVVCTGGEQSIQIHEKTQKHIRNTPHSTHEEEVNIVQNQRTIEKAVADQLEAEKQSQLDKQAVMKAEIMLVQTLTKHNVPLQLYNCLSDVLPIIFPDSDIVKKMELHETKASYLLNYGIADYHRNEVLKCLDKPYSLNYDGSTVGKTEQMVVNVSFRGKNNLIYKSNLTTLEVTNGTGESISNMVTGFLLENKVKLELMISDQSDGCSTMLGRFKGCHEFNKRKIPTLPDLGGCLAHDACTIVKKGVKRMFEIILELFRCFWANLEKHSQVKNRSFKLMNETLGIDYKRIPKFIEVRFRYVIRLCDYVDINDRALYCYYTELVAKSKDPTVRPKVILSETEQKIIDIYLGNYIHVRLTVKFLRTVCKSIVDFIDYFESRKIRIQDRYPKMLELITTHFSRFLKDGGIKRGETATASKLLAVNYKDESLWLSKVNVFVGSGVKSFLADIRLNPNSEEVSQFYDSVYKYYLETSERMVEYFSKGLKSETVKYLTVLSPKAKDLPLEESRKKWGYLAEKFHNVVSSEEADLLHQELANYRLLPIKDHVHVNHVAVDQWYANLA